MLSFKIAIHFCSNTAQVLTSIAEASTEGNSTENDSMENLQFLQEALEFFQRCLSLQSYQLTQREKLNRGVMTNPSEQADPIFDPNQDSRPDAVEEEVWASIEEPVTYDSLIDTLMAQLGTLTTIMSVARNSVNFGWIEEYYCEMLRSRVELLSKSSERLEEISLVKAKFWTALAEAKFHHQNIGLLDYEHELNTAFHGVFDLRCNEQGLIDRADAEITFCSSILGSDRNISGSEVLQLSSIRWRHLTKALEDLTAASKLPQADSLARIHLRRGDCELMRYGLGKGPYAHELAAKSSITLMRNAEIYYRGAAKIGLNTGATAEEREASVKEAVVAKLCGNPEKYTSLLGENRELTLEIVADMQDDHLLSNLDLEKL